MWVIDRAGIGQALIAWNNTSDGGIYTRRYSPANPPPPNAGFTVAPTSGVVPLTITLTDTSTGTIAATNWNFGDGSSLSLPHSSLTISHTYLTTGTFTVVLTVTNPGGASTTSRLITVTAQITPTLADFSSGLAQGFESYELGVDPTFWLDQKSDATARDDFKVLWSAPISSSGPARALGTDYTDSNTVYSHYAIPGWTAWQNYEYTGQLKMTADGEIGLAFYSGYLANQPKAYLLYRPSGGSFQLAGVGSSLAGDLLLGVTPQANSWYRFRLQAASAAGGVTARAKVWLDGQSEPTVWQALATDTSSGRLTGGAVGVRAYGPGSKYFDDLQVSPLGQPLTSFLAAPTSGPPPLAVTLSNLAVNATQFQWNFGDGATSSQASPVHTYTQAGLYSLGLTVGNGSLSETLTRTDYLLVGQAQPVTLTQVGDTWRYFKGQSAPPGNWNSLSFDDSSWLSGPTGIGFGDGDDATVLSDMQNNYISVFARRVFTLTNPALVISLTLEIDYDDGFAAYLNGVEVARANLASTAYNATASSHEAGTPQLFDVSGQLGLLQAGVNVLALQGHNQSLSSSDFSLSPALRADMVVLPVAAQFSAYPTSGPALLPVSFFDNSSGEISSYSWSLGDGTLSTLSSPTHTYTQTGVYTVSLTVSGPGGSHTLTRTNYITVTETISRNWHLITTTLAPPVIGEHALAYLPPLTSPPVGGSEGGQIVLYGGNATGWPYETTTWEFDGTDWLTTTTTGPTARYGGQMAYLPPDIGGAGGGLILFGGSDESDAALNETWVYTASTWTELQISSPLSRAYHSLASTSPLSEGTEGGLYLFGGNDQTTYFNDVWKYENGTWSELPSSGGPPSPRTLAALTYVPANDQGPMTTDKLLLFGGRTVTGTLLADLWAYNLASATWTLLDPGGGGGDPPPRMAHTLTYDPDLGAAVLVGGIDNTEALLGDTWHYDNGWTLANPVTSLPPRAYQQAVYTPDGLVLFSNGEVWRYE